jgi:hypothetical protein
MNAMLRENIIDPNLLVKGGGGIGGTNAMQWKGNENKEGSPATWSPALAPKVEDKAPEKPQEIQEKPPQKSSGDEVEEARECENSVLSVETGTQGSKKIYFKEGADKSKKLAEPQKHDEIPQKDDVQVVDLGTPIKTPVLNREKGTKSFISKQI